MRELVLAWSAIFTAALCIAIAGQIGERDEEAADNQGAERWTCEVYVTPPQPQSIHTEEEAPQ